MKKILILITFTQVLLSHTCSREDDGIACTMEARVGLNVFVSLENGEDTTADGIVVTATDGDFSEVLMNADAGKADFFGVFERKGTYSITVTKSGYKTFISEPVTVSADECHVIGEQLNIQLERQ